MTSQRVPEVLSTEVQLCGGASRSRIHRQTREQVSVGHRTRGVAPLREWRTHSDLTPRNLV